MSKYKGSSIIEVIVVIVILSIWIVWAYWMLNSWQKLANTTENRIKAINIAREWIEAVGNIRDTNWIKFSSDYQNCWNTKNYDDGCIGNAITIPTKRFSSWSYILIQSGSLWTLSWVSNPSSTYTWGLTQFPVSYDSDWLIIQTGSVNKCTTNTSTWCLSIFTREIKISYIWTTDPETASWMEVHSIVKWVDNSKVWTYEIDLKTIFTNWKK